MIIVSNKIPVIAQKRKLLYREVVLKALEEFISTEKKITLEGVIRSARYSDGKSVGVSTIYAKNDSGSYIHQDIRSLIAEARRKQQYNSKGQIKQINDLSSLREQKIELKSKLQSFTNQLVEQRIEISEFESKVESNLNEHIGIEEELYIAVRLTNELCQSVLPDFTQLAKNFRDKFSDDIDKIQRVEQSVSDYLKDIKKSKVVRLKSRYNTSKD